MWKKNSIAKKRSTIFLCNKNIGRELFKEINLKILEAILILSWILIKDSAMRSTIK